MLFFNALTWTKVGRKSKKNDIKQSKPDPKAKSNSVLPPFLDLSDTSSGRRQVPLHSAVPLSALQVVMEKMDEIIDRFQATNTAPQGLRDQYETLLAEYEASTSKNKDRAYNWDDSVKAHRMALTDIKGKIEKAIEELAGLEEKYRNLSEEGIWVMVDRLGCRREG